MGDDVAAKIPPADPKETAVAIKGLPRSATESALMNVVGAHGKMLRVRLDGLGGAHVVFASTRAAQRAAVSLNGAVVDGAKITAQHVRTFAKTTRPCRGFQEGKCRKGDQCKYWHGTETEAATPKAALTAPPTVSTAKPKKKNSETMAAVETVAATATPIAAPMAGDDISGIPKASICRNFAKGTCAHADKCRYAHVLGAGPLPPPARASIPTQCTFFAAGKCTKGDDCAFLHGAKPSVAAPPANKLPPRCSFFAAGKCARGSQCGFAHVPPTLAATAATGPKQPVVKLVAAKAVSVKKVKSPVVEAPVSIHGGEEDRTCIECEQPGTATWRCEACENALYCDDCKTLVHRPKVMKAHTQERLPEPTRPLVCGECEAQAASVQCEDCGVVYCDTCDASVHQFKSLRGHTRSALAKSSSKSAPATEKKVVNEKKAKSETVASSATSYIESVPQYDLPSESESSSEEEEDEKQEIQHQSIPQRAVKQTAVQKSGSESEDEEEESPAAAAMRAATTGYTKSVPKYELSSESESSSEDEVEDDDSVERVEPSIVKAAVVEPKQAITTITKNATSSDSDDDDFEDERPIVTRPVQPTPTRSTTRMPSTITISSESESESESDSEHGAAKPPTTKTLPVKRKASSSDSDSESSDDGDGKRTPPPVKQQPRLAPKTTARPAAAPAAKVGISTGSSHTLVKAIEAYAESDRTDVLHLDPNLNGFERLLAHDCAERLGLDHVSVGEGLDRHITVARKGMGLKRGGAPTAGASSSSGKRQKRV